MDSGALGREQRTIGSTELPPAIVFMTPFESSSVWFQGQAVQSAAVSHSGLGQIRCNEPMQPGGKRVLQLVLGILLLGLAIEVIILARGYALRHDGLLHVRLASA